MKKIPLILLLLIVAIVFGIYFVIQSGTFQTADTITKQEDSQVAPITDGTLGEPFYFACDDKTQIRIKYSENAEQAELAFHDELFTLQRGESGSGARYVNQERGIEYWEHQGEVTITQAEPELTITCLTPTTE